MAGVVYMISAEILTGRSLWSLLHLFLLKIFKHVYMCAILCLCNSSSIRYRVIYIKTAIFFCFGILLSFGGMISTQNLLEHCFD